MTQTTRLTAEVQQIFTEMLDGSDWLDVDTKQLAKEKLLSMSSKIGYPSYILQNEYLESEYEGVSFIPQTLMVLVLISLTFIWKIQVEPTAYFENVLRMLRHVVQEEFKRLNRPVDRDQWSTTPAVVNAYYSRTRNQMSKSPPLASPALSFRTGINLATQLANQFINFHPADSFTCRHPSTAFLSPAIPARLELRRHRRGDRSRDHARIRRPRPTVWCQRQSAALVARRSSLQLSNPNTVHYRWNLLMYWFLQQQLVTCLV